MIDPPFRSPRDKVGGLYHFGRMLDKIRLHLCGSLPGEYEEKFGARDGSGARQHRSENSALARLFQANPPMSKGYQTRVRIRAKSARFGGISATKIEQCQKDSKWSASAGSTPEKSPRLTRRR